MIIVDYCEKCSLVKNNNLLTTPDVIEQEKYTQKKYSHMLVPLILYQLCDTTANKKKGLVAY